MFEYVDCIRLYVENINEGIEFYNKKLGLKIAWKMEHAIGFLMNDQKTEIVIQNFDQRVETDIKVNSVIESVEKIIASGGRVVVSPFDIEIGKCAIVEDPWGNKMTILDSSKGLFKTDKDGNIIGQMNDN
jgi:lactoylglutathione lyase